jgi:hypothetical protein
MGIVKSIEGTGTVTPNPNIPLLTRKREKPGSWDQRLRRCHASLYLLYLDLGLLGVRRMPGWLWVAARGRRYQDIGGDDPSASLRTGSGAEKRGRFGRGYLSIAAQFVLFCLTYQQVVRTLKYRQNCMEKMFLTEHFSHPFAPAIEPLDFAGESLS